MAHSPAHGAMLIAGVCKRPHIPRQEKAKSEKEFYKEYRCCSKQDRDGNVVDSTVKCCYEKYQSGEGPNIQHQLEMNIASVTRDAMNPAFEAAKAEIEAGSSSEEIAKAVLGEYQKANEKFTLSLRNAVLEEKTSREAKEQAKAADKAAADKAAAAAVRAAAVRAADKAAADKAAAAADKTATDKATADKTAADKAAADNAVAAALVVKLAEEKAVQKSLFTGYSIGKGKGGRGADNTATEGVLEMDIHGV